jgi:hypothetical protein
LLGELPLRAYVIVASACKKANLPLLMIKLYELIKNENRNDKTLYKIILYTLARSVVYSNIAIKIFEDIDEKGVDKPDLYMYYTALVACDSGMCIYRSIYIYIYIYVSYIRVYIYLYIYKYVYVHIFQGKSGN